MPLTQLTQRQPGERLKRPQRWVDNGATGNRRVDVSAFLAWACGSEPENTLARLPERVPHRQVVERPMAGIGQGIAR
jgi:hypothetical protein